MACIINAAIGAVVTYTAPVIITSVSTNMIASAGAIAAIGAACATYQQISNDGVIRWCINKSRRQTTITVPSAGTVVVRDGKIIPTSEYILLRADGGPSAEMIATRDWVLL